MSLQLDWQQFLKDPTGQLSSKRLVVFGCSILMFTGYLANLFFKYHIDEFIWNGVRDIVVAGLGFSGLDHFAQKNTDS